MPFETENRLGHNWYIRKNIINAMRRHEAEGALDESVIHLYIGDTPRIEEAVAAFEQSAQDEEVATARVYARLSCTGKDSKKYHVVSLYQTERYRNGRKKQILEATWTPKGRTRLGVVTQTLREVFTRLAAANPKYGGKPIEIVGVLHEFK